MSKQNRPAARERQGAKKASRALSDGPIQSCASTAPILCNSRYILATTNHETPPDLILASASPRRRELLERLGLVLRIEPVDVDETPAAGEKPRAYAQRLAAEKGEAALAKLGQQSRCPF